MRIENNEKNQRILAQIVFSRMSHIEIENFVITTLMDFYEADDEPFECDIILNCSEDRAEFREDAKKQLLRSYE